MTRVYRKPDGSFLTVGASRSASRFRAAPNQTATPGVGSVALVGHPPSVSAGGVRPTTSATSIAVGGITFSWSGSLPCGYYVDGQAFVVAPSGVTLNDPTPARTTITDYFGSVVVNGGEINPQLGSQSLDERWNSYAAGPTFPYSAEVGDCLLKVISRPALNFDYVINYTDGRRKGLAVEQAALFVVSETPPTNAFAPPVYWPEANKVNRPAREADISALVSALPSYATGTHTARLTWSGTQADKFAPIAQYGATQNGYQDFMPFQFYQTGNINYGEDIVGGINRICVGLISDYWSTADKSAALTRLIQHGIQWGEPRTGLSQIEANGGHYQWHAAPIAVMLYATGQTSRWSEFFDVNTGLFPGNQFAQTFQLTSDFISTKCTPHSNTSYPYPYRLRSVSAVSGNTIGVPIINTGTSGDGPNARFVGMYATRQSDGAQAMVTGQDAFSPNNGSTLTVTLTAQPSPAFSVNDVIYFAPQYTLVAGEYDWKIRKGEYLYNPSASTAYRSGGQNTWSGQVMLMAAMGLSNALTDPVFGYVERANEDNNPLAGHDFPAHHASTWEQEMWDQHWTTMKAVPSVL